MTKAIGLCLLLTAALPGRTRAESDTDRAFADAQAMFESAKAVAAREGSDSLEARRQFREAAEHFARLADRGVASPQLYVNAGNAYHFAGDDARAVLWYLRAMDLANTPDIRSGVASLRRATRTDPWPAERASIWRVLLSWHYDLSRPTKQMLFLLLYLLGCGFIVIGLVRKRPWLAWKVGLSLMVLGAVLGVSDIVAASFTPDQRAVVVDRAPGRTGDGENYSIVTDAIRPGQEVRIVERRPEWSRVELPSGNRVWMQADAVEPVSMKQSG
jgi:hypothetical protein